MKNIEDTLRAFGITRRYKGFHYICYSIAIVLEDDFRLEAITKEIYMEVASHFGCKWTAVERDLRTVVSRAWQVNPTLLCQMAGYPIICTPTNSEFLSIITSYLIRFSE